MKDLVVLVADKQMEATLRQLLQRHDAFGIRPIEADVFNHPGHDPGVLLEAGRLLSVLTDQYRHALVLFDREGCGQEDKTAEELEQQVQQQLDAGGWRNRSAVVVLDPELEIWVWSDSPHVPGVLGLPPRELKQLVAGQTAPGRTKPDKPKELMVRVLRQARVARSAALYAELARKVGTARCTDRAFLRLKRILGDWFPRAAAAPLA
jgi:hypothetical protein